MRIKHNSDSNTSNYGDSLDSINIHRINLSFHDFTCHIGHYQLSVGLCLLMPFAETNLVAVVGQGLTGPPIKLRSVTHFFIYSVDACLNQLNGGLPLTVFYELHCTLCNICMPFQF